MLKLKWWLCLMFLFPTISYANDCIQTQKASSYIHIAKIDLHCPNLELVVSEPQDNGLTVSEFAQKHQTDIAINGSFYRTDLMPIGLTIANGKQWKKTRDFTNKVFFACDRKNRCFIEKKGTLSKVDPKWHIAISGWQSFEAKSGKFECAKTDNVGCKPNIFESRHPRTMLGLDKSKRWLYLVVVEGRQFGFAGMSLDELAELAQSLHLEQALNLDGGGSSVMVVGEKRQSDLPFLQTNERNIANHLGVKIR